MSSPPNRKAGAIASPDGHKLLLPHPIVTKRTRTNSTTERALGNPIECGKIRSFCRSKGHGFVIPNSGGEDVFVHISDIDGEYVPREGDEVTYRLCPIPPKMEKYQAVHVNITHFSPEVHLRWNSPLNEEEIEEGGEHKPVPV